MGKYEREWAEQVEQDVTNAFNGKNENKYDCIIAQDIKNELVKKNINFDKAKWSGGANYGDAGDINIEYKGKIVVGIELKTSHSKGKGTKANLGQGKFKEYISSVIGYEKFDEDLGLKKQRYDKVERYLGIKLKNKSDYERNLREIKLKDKDFIKEIAKITEDGAIKYAKYIQEEGSKNLDNINNMVEDILNSKHVKSSSSTKRILYCIIQDYQSDNQKVYFEDFSNIDSKITNISVSGKSIKLNNSLNKTILSFSVHWKNICQGGATPCFNVFYS